MAATVWTGPGGSVSFPKNGFWDVATNWNSGFAPRPGDVAILPHGLDPYSVTLGDGVSIEDENIAALDVRPGVIFTIAVNATLTIGAGDSVIANRINGAGALVFDGGNIEAHGAAFLTAN